MSKYFGCTSIGFLLLIIISLRGFSSLLFWICRSMVLLAYQCVAWFNPMLCIVGFLILGFHYLWSCAFESTRRVFTF